MNEYLSHEIISTVITVLIVPMLGIITKYFVKFLKNKVTELEHRINNDVLNKYITLAEDAVETAVISVNQTLVDTMKKQGTFDQSVMEEVFGIAKQKALAIMGASAQNALKNVYEDLDAWLDSKIEFYVNQNKGNMKINAGE